MQLYLIRIILSQSFLKFKTFIYNSNSKIIYNFCICGVNTSPRREKFINIGIFRKNASLYTQLMSELHVCYNLNQIYLFFSTFNKNTLQRMLFRNAIKKLKTTNCFFLYIYCTLLVLCHLLFFVIFFFIYI